MATAKHTPGPWEMGPEVSAKYPDHLVYISIFGAGRRLSSVSVYGKKRDGETGGKVYKDAAGTERHPRTVPEDECRANARLIAAAPDLLESLRGIVRTVNHLREEMPEAAAALFRLDLTNAHEAIAKAEG